MNLHLKKTMPDLQKFPLSEQYCGKFLPSFNQFTRKPTNEIKRKHGYFHDKTKQGFAIGHATQ